MDEMVGRHHRLNGHGFEQALGDGEGQRSLECCSPWGRKESDTTERRNNSNLTFKFHLYLQKDIFSSGARQRFFFFSVTIQFSSVQSLSHVRLFAVKSLLQHHSSKASVLQYSAFLMVQLSYPYMTIGKTIALTRWTFVGKVISLLFNMLSSLVIALLPRNKILSCWHQNLIHICKVEMTLLLSLLVLDRFLF